MRGTAMYNYMRGLVDRFFKILPMWEDNEDSLPIYLESLLLELEGFNSLMYAFKDDGEYVTLLSILRYLLNNPDTEVRVVKREVFRAISICNRLRFKYFSAFAVRPEDTSSEEVF